MVHCALAINVVTIISHLHKDPFLNCANGAPLISLDGHPVKYEDIM